MLIDEFINMCREDLVTENNDTLNELLSCVENIFSHYSKSTDIDSSLSIRGLYSNMENYAKTNNITCFCGARLQDFILDYFKLNKIMKFPMVNLEDFM